MEASGEACRHREGASRHTVLSTRNLQSIEDGQCESGPSHNTPLLSKTNCTLSSNRLPKIDSIHSINTCIMEAPVGDAAAQTPACPLASLAPLVVPASTSFELSLAPTGTDSLSRTLTHLHATPADKGQTGSETDDPSQSNLSGFEKELEAEVTLSHKDPKENILSALPQRRKSVLLLCFCLSMFM